MTKDVKFGFGLCETRCETEEFDTIDELLMNAQCLWDNGDVPFEDADKHILFVGTIERHIPSDFAPSLDDIAYAMTDIFYSELNVDDDADVQICNRKEAEKLWKEFVNKYFDIPCSHTAQWFGEYDLAEHKWIKKYANFDEYVKE